MEITGKIIAVLPERGGVSARTGNEWKSQEFVIETHDQYPKKCVFRVFGTDRLAAMNIQSGEELTVSSSALMAQNDWKLVWSDEFNTDGLLDSKVWNYEEGFKRNHEAQCYQKANAYCKDGNLVIEARKEKKSRRNPG